jgi:hypothetical protein
MLIETRNDPKQPNERVTRGPPRRWHAVGIIASSGSCGAAQACKGKRFLSTEAPRLPLANCDAARCNCKYRHFEDRRAAPRRGEEKAGMSPPRASTERRTSRGRRATD